MRKPQHPQSALEPKLHFYEKFLQRSKFWVWAINGLTVHSQVKRGYATQDRQRLLEKVQPQISTRVDCS